jgi:hypothetical protein
MARPIESGVRFTELHIEGYAVSRANCVDIFGYYFEILNLHDYPSRRKPIA